MQTPGDGAVVYSHDGRPALALAYSTKGNVTSLAVGRGLRDDDLERLIAAFTAPRPRHVMTVVIFSDVPALGFWRYRDLFRVLPLPPGAPRPRGTSSTAYIRSYSRWATTGPTATRWTSIEVR